MRNVILIMLLTVSTSLIAQTVLLTDKRIPARNGGGYSFVLKVVREVGNGSVEYKPQVFAYEANYSAKTIFDDPVAQIYNTLYADEYIDISCYFRSSPRYSVVCTYTEHYCSSARDEHGVCIENGKQADLTVNDLDNKPVTMDLDL